MVITLLFLSLPSSAYPYLKCTSGEIGAGITEDFLCVEPGDTFDKIYYGYVYYETDWTKMDFAERNGIPWGETGTLYMGQKLFISEGEGAGAEDLSEPEYAEYVTRDGDSMWDLYHEYRLWEIKVEFYLFLQQNDHLNYGAGYDLYPGQKVRIPRQKMMKEYEEYDREQPERFYIYDRPVVMMAEHTNGLTERLISIDKKQKSKIIFEIVDGIDENPLDYARKCFTEKYGEILDTRYASKNLFVLIIRDYEGRKNFVSYYGYKRAHGGLIGEFNTDRIREYALQADGSWGMYELISEITGRIESVLQKIREGEAEMMLREAMNNHNSGRDEQAVRLLKKIISDYEWTKTRMKASKWLAEIYEETGDHSLAYAAYFEEYKRFLTPSYQNYVIDDWEVIFLEGCMKASQMVGECETASAHANMLIDVYGLEYPGKKKTAEDVIKSCSKNLRGNCEVLRADNPIKGSLNIVFVAEGLPDKDEVRERAENMMDYIRMSSVLEENYDMFNFFLYEDTVSDFCTNAFHLTDIENSIIKKSCGMPDEIFVFISGGDFNPFSCYRFYICMPGTEPAEDDNSIVHELGHAAFELKDEYVYEPDGDHHGKPNCAPDVETAKEWWGDLESEGAGYFQGCAYIKENVRPTEVSVMTTLDETLEFGPVNERTIESVFYLLRNDRGLLDQFGILVGKIKNLPGGGE